MSCTFYNSDGRGRTDTPCNRHRILSPTRLPIPPHRRYISNKAVVGFEPAIKVLQTRALPLGYTAIKKTGVAGFEPTNHGVKVRCLTAWLYPKNNILKK